MMDYKQHYRNDALAFDYWRADKLTPAELRRTQYTQILSAVKPGMRVLDIGSGSGWFSLYAAGRGAWVTALDLSEENLQRIKAKDPRINVLYGDACEVPEPEEKYDLVAALEVVEHLVEPAAAVAGWLKLLKPGGTLLVTVPYKEIIRYSLCVHCNQPTPFNAHLHSFDRKSLGRLLEQSGFRIKAMNLFSHRLLDIFRINKLTLCLPFGIWRGLDRLAGLSGDKYSYLAIRAVPGI